MRTRNHVVRYLGKQHRVSDFIEKIKENMNAGEDYEYCDFFEIVLGIKPPKEPKIKSDSIQWIKFTRFRRKVKIAVNRYFLEKKMPYQLEVVAGSGIITLVKGRNKVVLSTTIEESKKIIRPAKLAEYRSDYRMQMKGVTKPEKKTLQDLKKQGHKIPATRLMSILKDTGIPKAKRIEFGKTQGIDLEE